MRNHRSTARAAFLLALLLAGALAEARAGFLAPGQSPAGQQPPTAAKPAAGAPQPADILVRVYEMSLASNSYERGFLLVNLAETALPLERKLAARCARELFEVSLGVPAEWFNHRHAFQMNAVRLLAAAGEVQEAADLFERMEPPPPDQWGLPDWDLREQALTALLPARLKGNRREALAWAVPALGMLSASGSYPYLAARRVIEELLRDDPHQAEAVYAEALDRFQKGKDKENRRARENFVSFLTAFAGKFQPALERAGVSAAVDAVLEAKPSDEEKTVTRLTLKNRSTIAFSGAGDQALYNLFPLLAKYEPERAQRLAAERAQLKAALDSRAAVAAEEHVTVIPLGEEAKKKVDATAARTLAWARAQMVAGVAEKDPQRALSLMGDILEPAPQAAAVAGRAAALAEKEPQQARSLLAEADSLLDRVKEKGERLRALAAILKGYVSLKDPQQVARTYQIVLALGPEAIEEEFAARKQRAPLPMTGAFRDLTQATRIAAKLDPEARLAEIAMLDNQLLQWHLMIEVARSLSPAEAGRPQPRQLRVSRPAEAKTPQ